jgi:hypothetical protein
MKLISMSDFVLIQRDTIAEFTTKSARTQLPFEKIVRYAEFLKQPLKLGMFLPCDENEKILIFDYPQNKAFDDIAQINFENSIKVAKEKVLFEGFVFKDNVILLNSKIFFGSAIDSKQFFILYKTIEDLSIHFLANEITLTPNAIKHIFGKIIV